jgi:prepilin-type N-terminal cleavage/methylation domain-containing protein
MHMLRKRLIDRSGFSLTEVLVVIGILALIMAIAAGAYFAIAGNQQQDAAKATMSKIDGMLLRKIKSIRDRIKDDIREKRAGSGIPELKNAGFTNEAAEAIMMFLRLKNELPMTYLEATVGIPVTTPLVLTGTSGIVVFAGAQIAPASLPPGAVQVVLAPRAEFKGMTGADPLHLQAAACFYKAITAGGVEGTEQQIGEISTGGYKCFTASQKPVIFTRLAYTGDQNELNAAPYAKGYDPFFPKKLPNGSYQNLAAEIGVANANALWEAATPVNPTFAVGTINRYLPLTYWGIPKPATAPAPGNTGYPALTFHTACAISWGQQGQDAPDPGAAPAIYGNGNIVSYRLREEGARGD